MEKKELLPEAAVKITASVIVFIFTFLDLILPSQELKQMKINYRRPFVSTGSFLSSIISDTMTHLLAADFNEAVTQGRSLGSGLVEGYSPQNINQTIQSKGLGSVETLTPKADEAQQQQGNYEGYYTNPGDMSASSTNTDVGNFLNESYEKRQKFDLSQDPTFGSKCLETDAEGKCIMWSSSKDLITNTYTDCEKVVIPEYDDPPTEAICTGTNTIQTTQCEVKTFVRIETETIYTPCSSTSPEYRPGQIYAVCRDYHERYKVYDFTGRERDDCYCSYHEGAFCDTPSYYIYGNPPPGATYLGMSYENFRDRDRKSGWDDCTSDRYKWYAKYQYSVIERIYLQYDSPCGPNVDKWSNECSVNRLEQCDPSGNNCVVSIENGQDTGQMPNFDYLTKVSQGTATTDCSSCTYSYDEWENMIWTCPNGCIAGVCPSDTVLKTTPVNSAVQIGTEKANVSYSCDIFCDEYGNCNTAFYNYETFYYYKDPLVCQDFSGSLENYLICLKYYTVELNNGSGLRQLSNGQVREDNTTNEYGSNITWFRIYGGSDVKPYLNNWLSRVTFSCDQVSDECQSLRDQGCVPYSQRCLDDSCEQIEHTYRCGGTGGVKNYKVAYNCAGNIRCMGSDCADTSYQANQDFAAATTAAEIMHAIRTDGTETEIFPGKKYECQSEAKNCCKPNTGGVSIADYVAAASAGSYIYTTLSTGVAATSAATAASITGTVNSVASTMGITSSVSTTTAATGLTTTTTSTFAGTTVTVSTTTTAGTAVGETTVVYSGAMSSSTLTAVATIATVAAIIIAAYVVCSLVYSLAYGCDEDDMKTSVNLGFNLCHEIGEKCTSRAAGVCLQRKRIFCCFNSILARIIHEQGRQQIGRGWGDVDNPDCKGLAPGELNAIDFSQIDLREYMQYIQHKTKVPPEKMQEISDRTRQKY